MSSSFPIISSPFTTVVVRSMRKLYPESLADKSFDNTGLLLEAPFNPDRRNQRNSVLLTIDLTKAVADEAIERRDSLVVAYHPIIFRGLKSLTLDDPQQQSLLRLAQEGISVYSPHTAVDAVPGGMADWLCDVVTRDIIQLVDRENARLQPSSFKNSSSFMYSQPSYPRPQAAVFPTHSDSVIGHTRSTTHPSPPPVPDGFESAGAGRLVTFAAPQTLPSIIDRIAHGVGFPGAISVAVPQSRSSSIDDIRIRTVGICPGSGASVLLKSSPLPDLLFTGELSHHEALAVIERGSAVVALGHSNTERGYLRAVMRPKLEDVLTAEWEMERARVSEMLNSPEAKPGSPEALDVLFNDSEVVVDVSERDQDPYGVMIRGV